MKRIIITGKPISKKRPRFARAGKFVKTYSDQKAESDAVKLIIKSQYKDTPLNEPVRVNMTFFMQIPESLSKKKKAEMPFTYHTKKPDIDNLIKFYLDCLNGIVWHDDACVGLIFAVKVYSESPKTIITIAPTSRSTYGKSHIDFLFNNLK